MDVKGSSWDVHIEHWVDPSRYFFFGYAIKLPPNFFTTNTAENITGVSVAIFLLLLKTDK